MDVKTNKIAAIECVDVRQVDRKSTNMEKFALQKCLADLKEKETRLDELVTDQHAAITKYIREYQF